ncbi:MAG: FtsQ-type POTRA domain-containing protein, partial [Actinobacteria bacterium]|nr:FtsQ-type POTRA domain-containing protein [Actinomycetota bacterium]
MTVDARVDTDPRISRRRRAVERSRRRRMLVRSIMVISTAFVTWSVLASPLLGVRHVQLTGARHTTADEISAAAGLVPGVNLLLLSTTEVASRVQTLPWVKSAQVERKLPGTVAVRVVEREPAMALSVGAARWTVDGAGRVLTPGEVGELPILAGTESGGVEEGVRLEAPGLRGALRAFASMPDGLRARVAAAFAPSAERISFSLDGGTLIRYGSAEQLIAKGAVASAVLQRV